MRGAGAGYHGPVVSGHFPTAVPRGKRLDDEGSMRVSDTPRYVGRRPECRWGLSAFPATTKIRGSGEPTMSVRIDCDSCLVRGLACHDCVVTVLLGPPPELGFDDDERRALDVLADSGLVPPLRMVTPLAGPEVESA